MIPVFVLPTIPVFMLPTIPVFMLPTIPVFMLPTIPVFMLPTIPVFILHTIPVFILHMIPVFDSWGKPGLEVLEGDSWWLGNFDQCLSISIATNSLLVGDFHTRYCTVSYQEQPM